MIIELTNIVAGLILAMGILPSIPAIGDSLEKVAKWLGRFQSTIGVIAIILGILYFGLQGIVAIVAGFVLAAGIMTSIPAIGKDLAKLAKWLGGFQTISTWNLGGSYSNPFLSLAMLSSLEKILD
jgi:hypothetical protein